MQTLPIEEIHTIYCRANIRCRWEYRNRCYVAPIRIHFVPCRGPEKPSGSGTNLRPIIVAKR
jgi:hypothetical protein